jgi:radical SAM protein with 4Fe4S-binding SPASM domain
VNGGEALRIISWNVTFRCPLRCAHCYLDAGEREDAAELDTADGMALVDRISEVGRPILVLSGGEPLLRSDIFDLAAHATERGLRVALGTSGFSVTDDVAEQMRDAGIRKVAISIDSADPGTHDAFRGVAGAWNRAVDAVRAVTDRGIPVQIHTTIRTSDPGEIDAIVALGSGLGVRDYQFFFIVPTGRGSGLKDIAPLEYETVIGRILEHAREPGLSVRPTCAPQFVRVAERMGIDPGIWGRGCIAGISYCRITPTGDVTPCPYLPLTVGNVREQRFGEIWSASPVFTALRSPDNLKGKCGRCSYRSVCGGCRARAFGVRREIGDVCGSPARSGIPYGDYLAEDPWCPYEPTTGEMRE